MIKQKRSMKERNLVSLVKKLELIKKKQFVKSLRKNSTGIGYTLETLLGIKENRISDSDWGDIEIKTMRESSNSDISLFVINPYYFNISNDSDFIEKYGYPNFNDPEILSFVQTIKFNNRNKRGWQLNLDNEDEKLLIINFDEYVGEIPFFSIRQKLKLKMQKLVSVSAKVKKVEEIEYFNYNNAFYHENCRFDNFLDAIRVGSISLNPRMRKLPNGKVTKNGTAFRIKRNEFNAIFNKNIRLF